MNQPNRILRTEPGKKYATSSMPFTVRLDNRLVATAESLAHQIAMNSPPGEHIPSRGRILAIAIQLGLPHAADALAKAYGVKLKCYPAGDGQKT